MIVCNPPIPVESSSTLGYLGHWDQKDLIHFEIFCGGSDKAKIIEKGQAAASKDKQKSKTFLKKDTALYQHIPVPTKDTTFAKKKKTDNPIAIKLVKTDGDYDQFTMLGDYTSKTEKGKLVYEIAGTEQTFWLKKDIAPKSNYGNSKHKDADYYTRQEVTGSSQMLTI